MENMRKSGLRDQVIICGFENQLNSIQTINGVKFTPREIDILASILSGRTGKVIASFLNISPKTLEAHIHNLMQKLGCNSRESIRAQLENSGVVGLLRNHYINLRLQEIFKKSLKKAQLLLKTNKPTCFLIYPQTKMDKETGQWVLKGYVGFQKFLQQLGLKASLKPLKDEKSLVNYIKDICQSENQKGIRCFYLIDEALLNILEEELGSTLEGNDSLRNIFLLLSQQPSTEGSLVGPKDDKKPFGHYFLWLDILEKMFPEINFNEITKEFSTQYDDLLEKNYQVVSTVKDNSSKVLSREGMGNNSKFSILKKITGNQFLRYSFFAITGIVSFVLFKEIAVGAMPGFHKNKESDVHSELLIPNDAILLKRPYLMKQIEEKFKGGGGIKTIVLVGIGGAGKTILARYYGGMHASPIVWEINARSHETLLHSFKNLAYALANSKEKKDALHFIQNIQDSELKEKQLLIFIKKSLKEMPNWLLIYDNVESFEGIKDYFPYDEAAWGKGRVIITTQDKNIRNVASIHSQNIIKIEALSKAECVALFKNIVGKDDPQKTWKLLHQMPADFLSHIPPFPLDIALAAYYIKDIQIPYEQYLKKLYNPDLSFESAQKTILKSTGNYDQTRYSIMVSIFNKILIIHPEFKDLLLFVCLLDHNHVPKSLLELYKGAAFLEGFLRPLRQYYLITTDPYSGGDAVYRLEISTQKLGQAFLLTQMNDQEKEKSINRMIVMLKRFRDNFINKSTEHKALLIFNVQSFMRNLEDVHLSKNTKESFIKELKLILEAK